MSFSILRLLAQLLVASQMRVSAEGRERVPANGPVLLVCNHLGYVDPLVVGINLCRQVRILSKVEVFQWPLVGWLARLAGTIPIHRGESDRMALRKLAALLSAGECVLVFPEGTFVDPPAPAVMLPVKTGAAWLALRTDATIVPVGLWGTHRVWSVQRGWRPWRHPHVHVVFGEPYRPTCGLSRPTKAAVSAVADEMAGRIATLLPEEYRGYYATLDIEEVTVL
ncbi:MAG TPA: lysophospholipid acyltransferase family protein [Ktedonobacterales bacterium]|nr:lysophospholipid acyltransferase family protein [Ktedonobacterales bacterium]